MLLSLRCRNENLKCYESWSNLHQLQRLMEYNLYSLFDHKMSIPLSLVYESRSFRDTLILFLCRALIVVSGEEFGRVWIRNLRFILAPASRLRGRRDRECTIFLAHSRAAASFALKTPEIVIACKFLQAGSVINCLATCLNSRLTE